MKWAKCFETADRKVAETEIDKLRVSTVFLGLNHNFGEGPPILWETMVFGPVQDACYCYTRRCAGTREQAEAMHQDVITQVLMEESALSLKKMKAEIRSQLE